MPLTKSMRRVVLYESGAGADPTPSFADDLDQFLARDERDVIVMQVYTWVFPDATPEVLDRYRASRNFQAQLALAHTIPRECHAGEHWRFMPYAYRSLKHPRCCCSAANRHGPAGTYEVNAALPNSRVAVSTGTGTGRSGPIPSWSPACSWSSF
jgi:hypothetical protein